MTDDPFTVAPKPKTGGRPKLSLVDGGRGSDLTAKQQGFLQSVTKERLNASDAYRKNYDCKRMSAKGVHNEASKLMAHLVIAARIKRYWQAEERSRQSDAVSKGAAIIEKLEAIADDTRVSAASRIRALELLGKQRDVALFVDRTVDETGTDNRTPDEVRQELEAKLGGMLRKSTA
ncbi:unnamed protein product [marine sediment metagenome]|uniref:Terminase small subunit n=1 Tax=marine sediment metagenome TaxID=412755 RepID=X0SPC3_9ZZZZ